ncbi:MAG: alanine dehydrogenase [Chromatiaceae bacterium]|jgi:alanine dehydrogenase|nr:alanine dehydrogenase [Chromatiaceae bacterium]
MRIGIPREIKPLEGRVALIPEACGDLVRRGHRVLVERGAGLASGFADPAYAAAGAVLAEDAPSLYGEAELVVKVKEPWGPELDLLRPDHRLFSFLHLAADAELTRRLLAIGLTALAFETVEVAGGLPILAPMSDIAGRLAVPIGAHLLHRHEGGKGLLLGGTAAAERGSVVVLGAGNAGAAAAATAAGLGAWVTVLDRKPERLQAVRGIGPNVTALYAYADAVAEWALRADLLIGAVLVPGARAPRLIAADQVAAMAPGSVIVDISVDQGGCVETTRPTTYADPTYRAHEVTHFAVTNMPGAVPRSASRALCASLFPWVVRLAEPGWRGDPVLSAAINLSAGALVHPALAES